METNNTQPKGYPIEYAYAKGKLVYFRYLTEQDAISNWHLWFNSQEVTRNLVEQYWVNTPEDQINYLKMLRESRDRLTLAIVEIETNKHIGVGGLGTIRQFHKNAEVSVIIGEKKYRDGRYVFESLALLLEIGFTRLNLHKITASALIDNVQSQELNKLLGLKKAACLKEHYFSNGYYKDVVVYEVLRKDWLKSKRRPQPAY
ncbi:GNAT family N-acetyltransferase [Fibrobacterota bacterium]